MNQTKKNNSQILYSGIESIDEATNGFRPQQLICVSGPISDINEAFLQNIAHHAAIKQEKKVDFIFQTPFVNSPFIRYPDLDIGNPDNLGWKDYKKSLKKNVPDIILVNRIDIIEYFLHERQMPKQLKEIAVEYKIPVVVISPLKKKPKEFKEDSLELRKDFDDISDVAIIFNLKYVCNHYEKEKYVGKYYFLQTNIGWNIEPTSEIQPFCTEFEMRYSDYGTVFM